MTNVRSLASFCALVFGSLVWVACDSSHDGAFEVISVHPRRGETDLPVLPSPFTAEETTALRTGFDWAATTPLPETDEEGHPALYYVIALVDSRETYDMLALSGIYFDAMPLFPEELDRWNDQQGYLQFEGDGVGVFVFAFMPGAVFNRLRELAIAGESVV